MTAYYIINGRVIDPAKKIDAKLNVYVNNGRIVDVTTAKKIPSGAQVIDAKNCIVAPGFIDMHVHLRDPGFEYKEDIESGTRAAAAGGFTMVCCMPNTSPINDTAAVTEYILDRARSVGAVGVRPIGAISRGQKGEILADIGDMAKAGVVAISDDGHPVTNAGLMRRALEYARAFDLLVISHCEEPSLARNGVMHEGALSTELGLKGIPSISEELMVSREIMLSHLTGARVHIAHVSSAGSVSLIRAAKAQKIQVTAEVTPNHLSLTDVSVSDYNPNTKVNPPLRSEDDRRELIKALADGTIDIIATDHAPHNIVDKEAGFQDAAFGILGLETALPLALKLVHDRKLSMKRLIEAVSTAPARILKLTTKASLSCGADADITLFDPDHAWTIQASKFFSKSRNTPFDGLRVRGIVKWTLVGGKVVFKN